jgi:ERCC4-type nuclease
MSVTILIDTREQLPLEITAYPVEAATLPVGDYGVKGFSDWTNPKFIVERKSVADLVGSLTQGRERFMKEVELLRRFQFAAIVVEGAEGDVERGDYQSKATPQSILASLDAIIVRTNIHVFWCGTPAGAARKVEGLVRQFVRGIEKDYRKLAVTTTAGQCEDR